MSESVYKTGHFDERKSLLVVNKPFLQSTPDRIVHFEATAESDIAPISGRSGLG